MGVFAIGIERSFHVPVQSDVEHSYSYAFKSSPLPVTGYTSTIKVQAKTPGVSTVTWSSTAPLQHSQPGMGRGAHESTSVVLFQFSVALSAAFQIVGPAKPSLSRPLANSAIATQAAC
jgi:hypothetical protein